MHIIRTFFPSRMLSLLLGLSVMWVGRCACAASKPLKLSDKKVLLQASVEQRNRLLARMGLTNTGWLGAVQRDSSGQKLFVTVQTGTNVDQPQTLRTQKLVVVTREGAQA